MKISIINIKETGLGDATYIGRGRTSILGNPYTLKEFSREQAIENYRRWLWHKNIKPWLKTGYPNEVVSKLCILAEENKEKPIKLGCFCAPKPCHGEIIARAIRWLQRNWCAVTGDHFSESSAKTVKNMMNAKAVLLFDGFSLAGRLGCEYAIAQGYPDILYFCPNSTQQCKTNINAQLNLDLVDYLIESKESSVVIKRLS